MQSPKEQYLKLAEMGNEPPLLVLEPCKHIVKRRFTLLSVLLAMALLYYPLLYLILYKRIDWIQIGVFVVAINVLYRWLFKVSFKLYPDRAEKEGIFGKRTVYLKDANISILFYKPKRSILGFLGSSSWVTVLVVSHYKNKWKLITCDLTLRDNSRADTDNLINLFRSIGIELKSRTGFLYEFRLCKKYERVYENVQEAEEDERLMKKYEEMRKYHE